MLVQETSTLFDSHNLLTRACLAPSDQDKLNSGFTSLCHLSQGASIDPTVAYPPYSHFDSEYPSPAGQSLPSTPCDQTRPNSMSILSQYDPSVSKSSPTQFAFKPPHYPYDPRPSTMSSDTSTVNGVFSVGNQSSGHTSSYSVAANGNAKKRDDVQDSRFSNPFAAPSSADNVPSQAPVDPHYVTENNSTSNNTWQSSVGYNTHSNNSNVPTGYTYANGLNRQMVNRPQTSDGLPSYPTHLGSNVTLPSARTLVSQSGYGSVPGPYSSVSPVVGGFPTRYGSFDQAAGRYLPVGMPPPPTASESNELQFVSLAGPAPKKRQRRRYDEIERIYPCEWKGCDKAYGTLNHLNAHVAMQKHGEKRLPAQFKEMRKEWRRKKREEAAVATQKEYAAQAAAAAQQHHVSVNTGSLSSGDYPQTAPPGDAPYSQAWNAARLPHGEDVYSNMPYSASSVPSSNMNDPFGHRGSASSFLTSAPTWSGSDTRPTTANTVSSGGSPTDKRFGYPTSSWPSANNGVAGQYQLDSYGRKPAPGVAVNGTRADSDYATPTQANPTFNPYTMSL